MLISHFFMKEVYIESSDDDIVEKLHLLQAERIASEGKHISLDDIVCDLLKNNL